MTERWTQFERRRRSTISRPISEPMRISIRIREDYIGESYLESIVAARDLAVRLVGVDEGSPVRRTLPDFGNVEFPAPLVRQCWMFAVDLTKCLPDKDELRVVEFSLNVELD